MKHRLISLALVLALLAGLAACSTATQDDQSSPAPSESATVTPAESAASPEQSQAPEQSQTPDEAPPPDQPPVESEAPPSEAQPIVYDMPLTDTTVEFSFWMEGAPPFITPTLGAEQSYNTGAATEYLRELTNVSIKFREIDMFSRSEQFNLMVVSEIYPDMISGFKGLYSGGADKALDDEVIIDLTDMISNDMPAYRQILDQNPEYEKELLNDDHQMLFVAGFNDQVYGTDGPAVRQDWLDAVGMDIPKTYDEVYEVGKAFLTEFDTRMAVYVNKSISQGNALVGGFDLPNFDITTTGAHFYQKDGKVISALTEDDMKAFLTMMNKWYKDGILDQDFYTSESGQYAESTIFSDNCGIFWGPANFITQYNENLKDTGFYSVGMPLMRMEEDQVIHFTSAPSTSRTINDLCVSSTCENLDILAKWLDYFFTEDGQSFANYGIEGETYELDASGKPVYYEKLYNTPGTNFMQNSATYLFPSAPSLYVADRVDSVSFDDVAANAVELYNSGTDAAWTLPTNINMTANESDLYYAKIGDIETYAATEIIKFIIGDNNLDNDWDAYVAQLKTLGIQQCIDQKQAAYDRYLSR